MEPLKDWMRRKDWWKRRRIFGWSAGLESAKRLMSGRIKACRKCRTNGEPATNYEHKGEKKC